MKLPEALLDTPIVFLTGAGASMPLGLPATKEFLDRFHTRITNEVHINDDPPGFFKFVHERLSVRGDRADIEAVLGDLEDHSAWATKLLADESFIGSVLGGNTLLLTGFKTMCDQLHGLICDEVIRVYGNVDPTKAADLYNGLLGHYQLFFRHLCGGRETLPFFTLNYDTAIEEATSKLRIRLVDGIIDRPGTVGRVWSPTVYAEYTTSGQELTVVLVKLHGSVRLAVNDALPSNDFVEVPSYLARDPKPLKHLVLYPSLRPKPITTEPFRTGYRLLRECLSRPTTYCLVVIGCSLRDSELNSLLRDALDDNDKLYIVVVGPSLDHEAVAGQVGCDVNRVGVIRTKFGPENPDLLKAGQGRVLGPLRQWVGAAVGELDTQRRFGTTVDVA